MLGSMAKTGPKPRSAADRFWPKVDKSGDCWIWTASKLPKGYGKFGADTRPGHGWVLAHRFSFELHHGRPPEGILMHSCDNPSCVNPDHLREGTIAENNADMAAKGRSPSGDDHWTRRKKEQDDGDPR